MKTEKRLSEVKETREDKFKKFALSVLSFIWNIKKIFKMIYREM